MKHVVILKDVDYLAKQGGGSVADASELDLLAPGACAIVANDGTFVSGATVLGDLSAATKFDLFVGVDNGSGTNPNQYPRKIADIPRDLVKALAVDYAAPANQITVIGNTGGGGTSLNLPGVLVPGEVAEFRITRRQILTGASPLEGKVNVTNPHKDSMRVEYTIQTGDAVADVVQALVAKVNDHPSNQGANAYVTATSINGDTGIQLEATVYGQTLDIGTDQLLRQSSVTVTQDIDYGNGTGSQARELEVYASSRHGNTSQYKLSKQLYDVQMQSDVNETYDVWNFSWNSPGEQRMAVNNNSGAYNELVIFYPEGGSDEADIKSRFNLLITSGGSL